VKHRVLWITLGLLVLATGVAAAGGTRVFYRLYHREGASWIQYFPGDAFPVGGNLPGTNRWRYTYELMNDTGPGSVNTLYVFFNGDGGQHSDFPPVGVSAPGGWTPTYIAPPSGQEAWRERFRGLAAPVAVGASLEGYLVEFTWEDPVLPGPQSYDAVFTTGSETGTTTPRKPEVAVTRTSWGKLRNLYR